MRETKVLASGELCFVGRAEDAFERALKEQIKLHEGVTIMDLLKFLYQSTLGPFHLFDMMDETQLKEWIRKNLEDARPSDGPLMENLYGKKWVRLNFGPYKKRFGNDYQRIYELFGEAKGMKHGQLREYQDLLKKLFGALASGKIRPKTDEPNIVRPFQSFLKEYEEKNYPPIHHSKKYVLKNASEYLVVPCLSIDKLGWLV
ncbi:MAG: hypothetical protein ABSB89_06940 [Candidatus Bathyarchaeia archaeon]|jgi:hypothetical protein